MLWSFAILSPVDLEPKWLRSKKQNKTHQQKYPNRSELSLFILLGVWGAFFKGSTKLGPEYKKNLVRQKIGSGIVEKLGLGQKLESMNVMHFICFMAFMASMDSMDAMDAMESMECMESMGFHGLHGFHEFHGFHGFREIHGFHGFHESHGFHGSS